LRLAVIPAQAGIRVVYERLSLLVIMCQIPACAGMTDRVLLFCFDGMRCRMFIVVALAGMKYRMIVVANAANTSMAELRIKVINYCFGACRHSCAGRNPGWCL
jgi:hypothetical protein